MEQKYQDFIGMYRHVYPDGFCDHLIEEFERLLINGACTDRQREENIEKTRKEDYHYYMNLNGSSISPFNGTSSIKLFVDGLQNCFDEYTSQFDILKNLRLRCTSLKMQKTDPGAGYHVWHSEQGSDADSSRCLFYIAYLNTIEDAGETEFLYQRLRIPPERNTMMIAPASFTHTHRGNVVHGNKSKYIITGWFYLE